MAKSKSDAPGKSVKAAGGWGALKSVGRQLMEAAIRWASRHRRIRRIELDVAVENEGAVALYKSLGFEIEGRAVQALYKQGRYMDRYDMALLVDRVRRES